MKRGALIFYLFFISCFLSTAREKGSTSYPRVTFGAEWGYVATVQSGYHHNYFSPDGYRCDTRGNAFLYHSNGDVYVNVGCNFTGNWNLSLYVGYAGVHDIHHVIPISLRATRYFGQDPLGDRWFAFADLGSGVCIKTDPQEIVAGKLGGGYRFSLSRDLKLDFLLGIRMTYTHPQVVHDDVEIGKEWTNRNNAYVGAVSLGMAISF